MMMLELIHSKRRCNKNNSDYFSPSTTPGELRGSRTAEANGITAHGYAPALVLCRELLAAGVDPDTALQLYRRNNTLALTVRSIGEGAQLTVEDGNTGRPQFKPVRQGRGGTAAPVRGSAP